MKNVPFLFSLFCGICLLTACNGNNSSSNPPSDSSATASNIDTSAGGGARDSMNVNHTGSRMVDQNAVDFADKAATGGKLEVELGNLAEKKADRQRVKDFGKMMVDDHTKANNDLEAIASRENISLPSSVTKDQEKDIDKLSKKAGKDFDRAYIDMMVKDHKEDIKEFKEAEGKVTDNDIKNFITATLPVLEKHLDSIQAIRSGM